MRRRQRQYPGRQYRADHLPLRSAVGDTDTEHAFEIIVGAVRLSDKKRRSDDDHWPIKHRMYFVD
jgi:hypothetical protein